MCVAGVNVAYTAGVDAATANSLALNPAKGGMDYSKPSRAYSVVHLASKQEDMNYASGGQIDSTKSLS